MTDPRPQHAKIVELRAVEDQFRQELDEALADTTRRPLSTGHILKACNEVFSEDAIFVMDGAYGMEKSAQRRQFGRRLPGSATITHRCATTGWARPWAATASTWRPWTPSDRP